MVWSAIASKLAKVAGKMGVSKKSLSAMGKKSLSKIANKLPSGQELASDLGFSFEGASEKVARLQATPPSADPNAERQRRQEIARAKQEKRDLFWSIPQQLGKASGFTEGDQSEAQRAGNVAGNAFGAIAAGGALVGGPVGLTVAGIAKLGQVVAGGVERLRDWNEGLHAANMKFKEFSSSMTQVAVEQEIRDMRLSRERGKRRSTSARFLAEEKSRLDAKLSPYEDFFAKVSNYTAGSLTRITSSLTESAERGQLFGPLAGLALWAAKRLGEAKADEETDLDKWLNAGANTNWAAMGRPQRMQE